MAEGSLTDVLDNITGNITKEAALCNCNCDRKKMKARTQSLEVLQAGRCGVLYFEHKKHRHLDC